MSKKVYVVNVQPDPDGPTFGRVLDPNQMQKSQDFAHAHTVEITKDLLMAGANSAQVAGFQATRTTGLSVSIAAGSVVDASGNSYGLVDAIVKTMAAADPINPRIDLVYATLEIDAPAGTEFVSFRQLRTQAELEADAGPYVPTQFNQPTELHTRATIGVRTGTPGGSPAAPAVGDGEVPLWHVHVAANQVTLGGGDLTDVRVVMKSLYQIAAQLGSFDPSTVIKKDGSVAFIGDQSIGGHKLTNLGDPVSATDGVNLQTLQSQIGSYLNGLDWKPNVRAATTVNIALTGTPTIDGVALVAGNRVLVKNQTTTTQNGIYVVASGAWTRAIDADAWSELVSAVVAVDEGTTQRDTIWNCIADAGGTLGSTAVTWNQFPGATPLATSSVDGLMPHGDKSILDAAASVNTASTLMKRNSDGGVSVGTTYIQGLGALDGTSGERAGLYIENDVTLYNANPAAGLIFATFIAPGSMAGLALIKVGKENATSGSNAAFISICVANPAANYVEAIHVASNRDVTIPTNLSVTGTLSKGSGTFRIDHPLNPNEKDLIHGFIEGPRYDLIYRGRTKLSAGAAVVSIDKECGMSPGTFAALTRDAQGQVWNESSDVDNFDLVRVLVRDGHVLIKSNNPRSDIEVGWMVVAERNDAFIRATDGTDAEGRLLVEVDKFAGDPALLAPRHQVDHADDAAPSRVVKEVVTELVGTRYYPRHASVTGVGAIPTRVVTIETRDKDDNHYVAPE